MHFMNYDRKMFILIMIETTSQGSFDHDQTKHVKIGRLIEGEGQCPKDPILGLVEIWDDKEIRQQ